MRRRLTALCLTSLLVTLAHAGAAEAQDEAPDEGEAAPPPIAPTHRPTSGEPSLSSGRTLGVGEVLLAAGAGWPGVWGEAQFAPTSSFNLGLRATFLYGSPIVSLEPGLGAELAVPMRIHVYGADILDVAVFATPAFTFGEAALVGEGGSLFGGEFGWGSRLEFGVVLGVRPLERLTFFAGLGGHLGFVHTPTIGDPELIGALFLRAGAEGLIARNIMLFAVLDGGVGFAPNRAGLPVFREAFPGLFRASLGAAFLM